MSHMFLMLIGPVIMITLFSVLAFMIRDPKANVDNMILLRTLFIEHTGSPPTDEEYVIFAQLSSKEIRKIFKKYKK